MIRPNPRRRRSPASYYVTASQLWPAGIIAVTAPLAAADLHAVLRGGARWRLTRHRRLNVPGYYEIYGSQEAAMMTHTTVQALGQARLASLHDQARRDALVRAARRARRGRRQRSRTARPGPRIPRRRPRSADQERRSGMADINTLYDSLLAADEARDAATLAAVAWQMYGQLATTAADLGALRARFRVYATAPHASESRPTRRRAQTDACAATAQPGGAATQGDASADEEADSGPAGVAGHRGTTSTMGPTVRQRPGPGHRCLPAAEIGRTPAITHERTQQGSQVLAAPGQQRPLISGHCPQLGQRGTEP
jgi:hypothetical protein